MAKPKRPIDPYHVMDNDGYPVRSCSSLREAKEAVKHGDTEWPEDSPHRIYALVTLEERAVIRAGVAAAAQWKAHGWKAKLSNIGDLIDVLNRLVKAVEAARGK